MTALARRYDLSTDAIYRHRKAHLPAQLRAKLIAGPDIEIDLDRLRETESQSLLANLVALRHRLSGPEVDQFVQDVRAELKALNVEPTKNHVRAACTKVQARGK